LRHIGRAARGRQGVSISSSLHSSDISLISSLAAFSAHNAWFTPLYRAPRYGVDHGFGWPSLRVPVAICRSRTHTARTLPASTSSRAPPHMRRHTTITRGRRFCKRALAHLPPRTTWAPHHAARTRAYHYHRTRTRVLPAPASSRKRTCLSILLLPPPAPPPALRRAHRRATLFGTACTARARCRRFTHAHAAAARA